MRSQHDFSCFLFFSFSCKQRSLLIGITVAEKADQGKWPDLKAAPIVHSELLLIPISSTTQPNKEQERLPKLKISDTDFVTDQRSASLPYTGFIGELMKIALSKANETFQGS